MAFDLLLKGGTVLDPAQGLFGPKDVALTDGVVAALVDCIPSSAASRVLDVSGLLVTPGLIDPHTHLFKGVSPLGVDADEYCLARGISTSVDAGTAGSFTFRGFLDYCIRPAKERIYAYVHLASIGLTGFPAGEFRDNAYLDPDGCARTIEAHRDVCLGVKVRMGKYCNSLGLRPLEVALEVASKLGVSVMVDVPDAPVPQSEIFELLRPGDVITHVFHNWGESIIKEGRVDPALWRARERGVIADIGHGRGSLAFVTAKAALAEGFKPDTISTDLHTISINGPCFDQVTTMGKFMALGMSLEEVIAATTINPAKLILKKPNLGSLKPGSLGDVSVLELEEGDFEYRDVSGECIKGKYRFVPKATIVGGELAFSRLEPAISTESG